MDRIQERTGKSRVLETNLQEAPERANAGTVRDTKDKDSKSEGNEIKKRKDEWESGSNKRQEKEIQDG